ncbi:MAG TPA: flagellar motor switch protein FliN [Acidimicrobiia bacterium]|nr:flagellar motor switch protein FliN [Acidimicrobiia bacterium]
MTLISDLATTNDVAMTVAAAIERVLGDDLILAVGLPRMEPPTSDVLPSGPLHAVRAPFFGDADGSIMVFVGDGLATVLTTTSPDESLAGALAGAVQAGAEEVVRVSDGRVSAGDPMEINASEVLSHPLDGEFLVYPLLDGNERIACIVVQIADANGATAAPGAPQTAVAVHEFQPLEGESLGYLDPRPLSLLSDVEMGVTAELGRRRMTVRELLGLTPGSVIELDRAAGTPVDVLVNGTLIARGEVVVIDEEFGIRVSEIVTAELGTGSR